MREIKTFENFPCEAFLCEISLCHFKSFDQTARVGLSKLLLFPTFNLAALLDDNNNMCGFFGGCLR